MTAGFDGDDDRALLPAEEQESEAADALAAVTVKASGNARAAHSDQERQLLNAMATIAERHRFQPDARIRWLLDWMRKHLSAGISVDSTTRPDPTAAWSNLRVILFTEYEDTARYLRNQLEAAMGRSRHRETASRRLPRTHPPRGPQGHQARLQRAPLEEPAPYPHRHGRRPRRSQPPGPLLESLPPRPPLEPQSPGTAQRPHRPQAPAQPRGLLPLLRLHPASRGPRARRHRAQDRHDSPGIGRALGRHRHSPSPPASTGARPMKRRVSSMAPPRTKRSARCARKSSRRTARPA